MESNYCSTISNNHVHRRIKARLYQRRQTVWATETSAALHYSENIYLWVLYHGTLTFRSQNEYKQRREFSWSKSA